MKLLPAWRTRSDKSSEPTKEVENRILAGLKADADAMVVTHQYCVLQPWRFVGSSARFREYKAGAERLTYTHGVNRDPATRKKDAETSASGSFLLIFMILR